MDYGPTVESISSEDHIQKVNFWYYGKTGTGKSHAAREEFEKPFLKSAANHWWDGYQGEENVIIDDFDKYHIRMGYYLKIWADRYEFPAEIKGSTLRIRPKHIVVTSNYHPNQIWEDNETLEPILRRFKVVKFGNTNEHADEERAAYAPNFIPPIPNSLELQLSQIPIDLSFLE